MKKSEALKILGLKDGASDDEVKKAHRKKVIENHPDNFAQDPARKAEAEEQTKLINEARDVLLSGKWDPEFGSSARTTYYGNPYRNPHQSQGDGSMPQGWPFGVDPNQVWTVWEQRTGSSGQGQTQGGPFGAGSPFGGPFTGGQRRPFDPFNPFDAQQASQAAAEQAAAVAKSNWRSSLITLGVKLLLVTVIALQGSYLGAAAVYAVFTGVTMLAGRMGGCIWILLLPVIFYLPYFSALAQSQAANPLFLVPLGIVVVLAIYGDIHDLRKIYQHYALTRDELKKKQSAQSGS